MFLDAGEKWVEPTVIPAAPVANPPYLTTPEATSNARTDLNEEPVISIHNTKRSADEVKGTNFCNLYGFLPICICIFHSKITILKLLCVMLK